MKLTQLIVSALAVSALAPMANAAIDTTFNAGDLLLGFQISPSGTNVLEVNLGAANTLFRDATPGTTFTIGNISSQLVSLAGNTWYESTTLYWGAAGGRSSSAANNSATPAVNGAAGNGDPNSTIYISDPRTGLGIIGTSNSTPAGSASTSAGQVVIFGTNFNARATSGIYSGIATSNTWDSYNTFSGTPATQDTAFGGQLEGVQGQFAPGSFGIYGIAGAVEGALDLYRQARFVNSVVTPNYTADGYYYTGTLTIDQAGDVKFTAVPEPSTYATLALGLVGLGIFARRKSANA